MTSGDKGYDSKCESSLYNPTRINRSLGRLVDAQSLISISELDECQIGPVDFEKRGRSQRSRRRSLIIIIIM